MSIRNSVTIALIVLLSAFAAYADGIDNNFQDGVNGQFGNGTWLPNNAPAVAPPPPPFMTPTVVVNTCNIAGPFVVGSQIPLVTSGFCTYTALCGGLACVGGNAVTSWAITAQSCGGNTCFAIDNSGNLLGGVDAATISANNTYTVTVTASNATGTSPAVTQTVNVPPVPIAPTVTAATCTIAPPVTNGSPVTLSGGGNCTFTALCASVACTGGNIITGWAVVSQTCPNCFALDSSGDVLGGTGAGGVAAGNTYTMTVTAANANGVSAQQVQSIVVVPVVVACSGALDLSQGCMIPGIGP